MSARTKTTSEALRRHADIVAKGDDPDTTTALRWAADDIDLLNETIKRLTLVGDPISGLEISDREFQELIAQYKGQSAPVSEEMIKLVTQVMLPAFEYIPDSEYRVLIAGCWVRAALTSALRPKGPLADVAADAALAYALWDSENTVRMQAECIQGHVIRAQSVRHWLRLHGHDVFANEKWKQE